MAFDLVLFAIRDDDAIERWGQRFPESIEDLQFLHLYFSGERGSGSRDEECDRELRRLALEMEERNPGISRRRLQLDRMWDVLHFVLSPDRRAGVRGPKDPGTLALRGLREFHPMLRATQGAPVGYLPAGEVHRVLEHLISVTRAEVELKLREAEAPGAAVYKFGPGDTVAWADRVMEQLRGMIEFYEAVEEEGEAVLSVLD